MLTIIYTYRDRDLERLENSFISLDKQTSLDFEVKLVDYGSTAAMAKQAKKICDNYSFVNYHYCHTSYQPWNKSKALNSIIENLDSEYCFVADIDMLFHPEFVDIALNLQNPNGAIYFQVGFLEPNKNNKVLDFVELNNYRKSTFEATGLSLFPVKLLKKIQGFDEFYHFWGAEDTDVHIRLKNAGYKVEFYDEKVLMLHQWHPSYRSLESNKLTKKYQLNGIVQINHEHLAKVEELKIINVNKNGWGNLISKKQQDLLNDSLVQLSLKTEKKEIDNLLFGILPGLNKGIFKIKVEKESLGSPKSKLKKILGKKVPEHYSLKQVNDKIMLHLISFYRDQPYTYKIAEDLQSLELAIEITN